MSPNNKRLARLGEALSFGKTSEQLQSELKANLLAEIGESLPGIRVFAETDPIANLNEKSKLIGSGGTSQVSLGEYTTEHGKTIPVAIKRFPLQTGELAKISRWYSIIIRLGYINPFQTSTSASPPFPRVPHVLIPIAVVIQIYLNKIELVDISPYLDSKTKFPTDPNELLVVIYEIAVALSEMHARSIAHLDIKAANILWNLERSRKTPVLADLGEAICFLDTLQTVTVSTTLTLILNNPFIRLICKKPELLSSEHISPLSLFTLISFHTPQKYLWLIDNLLFGILLLNPWEVEMRLDDSVGPFRPLPPLRPLHRGGLETVSSSSHISPHPGPAGPYAKPHINPVDVPFKSMEMGEHKTIRKCGEELIIHAFLNLFPLWAAGQADVRLKPSIDFEQYFHMPINMSSICPVRNLAILTEFLSSHLRSALI